ncbi:FadR/GntR family transcriptional regulator [Paracoccus sp. PAR01]|uniref:FadR/GntR family transcriptional regulator n=1 Tax=Paracoccus sp. PAR01 TaxID=2769282 RepID=UPI0017820039|nr:FadR/GntR family transcriptional regulator [Paracoccus sp. PAR01]MBD9525448.1 FadR family transcriptional regulator [Paracoccus sp. PAR01]
MKQNVGAAIPPVRESMVDRISDALRRELQAGRFQPGDRLPSENELTRLHSVSRAVVREAIAALRADGLVEARKGAGVFALDPAQRESRPFDDLTTARISSVIELLELRTACEIESAALAAARRSPSQLEAILDAHHAVERCLRNGQPTRDADFEFHLAIAKATQNRRFPDFLQLIRSGIIPRGELQGGQPGERPRDYNLHLQEEHSRIVDAILEGDGAAASQRMREHLRGSLERYQELLRAGGSAN